MAIALRATNGATTGASGTLAVPVPTGTVSGDVLLISIVVSGTTVPATPAGLTLLTSANTGPATGLYYRVCDGTEGASFSFTVASGAAATSRSYSGVDNTTPINTNGTPNRTAASASCVALSITPTVNNCEIVWFGVTVTNGKTTFTDPTGFANQEYVHQTTGTTTSAASDDEAQTTAAATGNQTGTFGAAANNYGLMVALQPASSGVANTLTASPGTMTITGDAITPPVNHAPTANPGVMAITGSGTNLPVAHSLSLSAGSIAITGDATKLPINHAPTASPGVIVITGDAVTFIGPSGVAHALSVNPGSISVTGFAATLFVPVVVIPKASPYGADQYGFNPFPGRYPFYDFYPGPLSAWRPYMNDVMLVYDYATQLFVGLKDKSALLALGAANIGPRS